MEKPEQKPPRHKASALYEPTEAHRRLGLPIVAWTSSKWRPHSDEARLLFRMGLKRYPAIEDILILASDHTVPERKQHALTYFLEHFDTQYANVYSPSKQDLPFVPAIRNGQKQSAKPTETFSSAGAGVMGFAILDLDYQIHASKFKLSADPPSSALVKKLLESPPGTHNDARPLFAYLAGQASSKSLIPPKVSAGARQRRGASALAHSTAACMMGGTFAAITLMPLPPELLDTVIFRSCKVAWLITLFQDSRLPTTMPLLLPELSPFSNLTVISGV